MTILNLETKNVQNPALGAILLWRYAVGYYERDKQNRSVVLPLLFIVLPMILHSLTFKIINSTQRRSGLRVLASKFSSSRVAKSDLLLAIQTRSLVMRNLTTDSLGMAINSKLLSLNPADANVLPLSITRPVFQIPQSIQNLIRNSEKLGYLCSGLSLFEISSTLKVGF